MDRALKAATSTVLVALLAACGTTVETTFSSVGEVMSPGATLEAQAIVGTWTRRQDCEGQLNAFEGAGLAKTHIGWVTDNWVRPVASPDPEDPCARARPPEEHSHFFTAEGAFGSYDAAGKQVDDGDYVLADADTIGFPSHAKEFGYDGEVLVRFVIRGDTATFEVVIPTRCKAACLDAHAWALSAFYGPEPWTRSDSRSPTS